MGVEALAIASLVATVAGTGYSVNRQMAGERIAERERRDQRADVQRREDQLTNEPTIKLSVDSPRLARRLPARSMLPIQVSNTASFAASTG